MFIMNSYFHSQAAGENKRRRTRGLLIDTAIDIFSKKGIEAASIQEITTSAGLANGTFYNHFRDKDELAGCVSEAIALEIGRHLAVEMTDLDKGAVRVAVASWAFLRIALGMSEWAQVLAADYYRRPFSDSTVFRYMRTDLEMAVRQSNLDVEIDDFLFEQLASLMISTLQRQLRDGHDSTLMRRMCENMLRVIGLTPSQAKREVAKAEQHPLITKEISQDVGHLTQKAI